MKKIEKIALHARDITLNGVLPLALCGALAYGGYKAVTAVAESYGNYLEDVENRTRPLKEAVDNAVDAQYPEIGLSQLCERIEDGEVSLATIRAASTDWDLNHESPYGNRAREILRYASLCEQDGQKVTTQ